MRRPRNCRQRRAICRRTRRKFFRSAFNNAWATYADRGPHDQEEIAFRVAWAAVKKQYRKRGEIWLPKAGAG